jgi:hypothetical protein
MNDFNLRADDHLSRTPATLDTLSAEILLVILRKSLNPSLIHTCRATRDRLPAYGPFARALTSSILYTTSALHNDYDDIRTLMNQYWALHGIPVIPQHELDDAQWAASVSHWFRANRASAVERDVSKTFGYTDISQYYRLYAVLQYSLQSVKLERAWSVHDDLQCRIQKQIGQQLRANPGMEGDDSDDFLRQRQLAFEKSKREHEPGMIPDFVLLQPISSVTAISISSLIQLQGRIHHCSITLLRQAITTAILQDQGEILNVLLDVQHYLAHPVPQGVVTECHVKLASDLGRQSILETLSCEAALFQKQGADVSLTSKALIRSKPPGWMPYQMLTRKWRRRKSQRDGMGRKQDLWQQRMRTYGYEYEGTSSTSS